MYAIRSYYGWGRRAAVETAQAAIEAWGELTSALLADTIGFFRRFDQTKQVSKQEKDFEGNSYNFV